ncbi:MAG: hypothetical protein ACLP01_20610 [Solirubrobacteraceae bacterium]
MAALSLALLEVAALSLALLDAVALSLALLDAVALLLALLGLLEDPQPAITSTPDATTTAIGMRWRAR